MKKEVIKIPDDVECLICHAPPTGILDMSGKESPELRKSLNNFYK